LCFLTAWRVVIDLQIFLHSANTAMESKKLILYVGSFVLGLIVEKLFNESFLAVVGNVVEDLVDCIQEDLNILANLGNIVEDLVDGGQEDANELFQCNNGNVMTSIAVTFGDEKFDQEDTIKMGNNNDPDDLVCFDFSSLPLTFFGITFYGIEGFPCFWCYLGYLFTCFWHDLIIFLWVCA
jgi:hypothetical protein